MGIVCHCPNGHRVKVKDFQAGKRGLCPHCGAKFSIPAAAGVKLSGPGESAGDQPEEPRLPLARFVPLEPAVIATLPRATPFGAASAAAAEALAESLEPFAETMPLGVDPLAAGPAEDSRAVLHPAIADRPDLSWRIAYPGGEPSEPVDSVTMQAWIAGGQAEGTELVWRADWADWLPVRSVFPEFFPGV
jgi:hypothetical protein